MLRWALTFLLVALVAGLLGFWGLEGLAMWIAQVLFVVFLILFIVSLLAGGGGLIILPKGDRKERNHENASMARPPVSAGGDLERQRRELRAVFGKRDEGGIVPVRVAGRRKGMLPHSHCPRAPTSVWHCYLPDVLPDQVYGYRVYGPYEPAKGHRFNPNKVLLDPYAKGIARETKWSDSVWGYKLGDAQADLSFDERDSASLRRWRRLSTRPSPGATTGRRRPPGTRPSSTRCTSKASPSCIPRCPRNSAAPMPGWVPRRSSVTSATWGSPPSSCCPSKTTWTTVISSIGD